MYYVKSLYAVLFRMCTCLFFLRTSLELLIPRIYINNTIIINKKGLENQKRNEKISQLEKNKKVLAHVLSLSHAGVYFFFVSRVARGSCLRQMEAAIWIAMTLLLWRGGVGLHAAKAGTTPTRRSRRRREVEDRAQGKALERAAPGTNSESYSM